MTKIKHRLSSSQADEYTATKSIYQFFPEQEGRHVWVGQLVGEVGTVSVTWNAACDPRVFQLEVTLADSSDSSTHKITTVPCSGDTAGVPSCLWTAKVSTTQRDEYDPVDTK
jgi:hypothetical protein